MILLQVSKPRLNLAAMDRVRPDKSPLYLLAFSFRRGERLQQYDLHMSKVLERSTNLKISRKSRQFFILPVFWYQVRIESQERKASVLGRVMRLHIGGMK